MTAKNRKLIDKLGIISSGICAIHCMAFPILLSVGILSQLQLATHDVIESIIICVSAFLGTCSIINGLRGHGKLYPQVSIALGSLIIILALCIFSGNHIIAGIGGGLLLLGHWLNWRKTVQLGIE